VLTADSCNRLSARAISHPEIPLAFDKDDDDTLDFVLATANLRAIAYGIPTKTRFEVKQMAGNIIPAIATTNATIAGFIVMRAINILENDWQKATNVFLKADPARPLGTFATQPPEPNCGVCQDVYIPLACDPTKLTLGVFVNEIVRGWLGRKTNDEGEELEFSVYEGNRELSSPDDDDNHGKTLAEMNVSRGMMLTVVDEDNVFTNVAFPLSGL
jgi:ubiquitin-like 1-activating enzyme E1 B